MKGEDHKSTFIMIRNFGMKIGATAILVLLLWHFVLCFVPVRGETMYPRLLDGDLVGVSRIEKQYYIGDVLAISTDDGVKLGRLVAEGGDLVQITSESGLYINGVLQSEQVFYETTPLDKTKINLKVPEGSYYLLSDFRTQGDDSRSYGCISGEDVIGKVFFAIRIRGI